MNSVAQRLHRILFVAYPLLPVSDESCGGAEQMLSVLESELAGRGHFTTIAACRGSQAKGAIFPTGRETTEPDQFLERDLEHQEHILELLHRTSGKSSTFDVVHDKSGSFWRCAGQIDPPVLATLHLPRNFYPREVSVAPSVYFNCVSGAQLESFRGLPNMLGAIPNGVKCEQFPFETEKEDYLLWMGRICEEKGPQLAIEVCRRTGLPLVLMGQVYPFSYHQRFYTERVRPHLGNDQPPICFLETPTLSTKLKLLSHARALLVPSLVDETSSLVAMEAMACGTPVIGFRRGAIPEVVVDQVTGLVVNNVDEMSEAVWRASDINPHACRAHVELNHSSVRMAEQYEQFYERVLELHAGMTQPKAA